jgi:hypothetical protein
MQKGNRTIQTTKICHLTHGELTSECERLEALLDSGELSPKEGRDLAKIRAAIEQLEVLKYGV